MTVWIIVNTIHSNYYYYYYYSTKKSTAGYIQEMKVKKRKGSVCPSYKIWSIYKRKF